MISCFFKKLLFIFFLPALGFAQETDFLYQPEIRLNYSPENRWSFNFEVTNRNLLGSTDESSFKTQHLEFSHFTSYESDFYSKLSLGVKYRNRALFDSSSSDEFRLTQQYSYQPFYNQVNLGHRIRFEQRFYDDETVFRMRYRFGIDIPLGGLQLNNKELYTAITTETLYSLSKKSIPELDQRFTASLGKKISDGLKLQLSLEYRLENYLNNLSNRFFIYTTALIDL